MVELGHLGGVSLLPVFPSWFATSNPWCLEYLKLGGLSVCGRGVFPASQTPMLCPFALLCFSVEDLQGELEKEEKGKKDPCDCEYKAGQVGNLLPARGSLRALQVVVSVFPSMTVTITLPPS